MATLEGDQDIVVAVRGLRTQFGKQVVHEDLDLDVQRGEVLGVVGGSGTGKSVLLKHVIGLTRPAAGTIDVLGYRVTDADRDYPEEVQRRMGVLFQDGALFSSLTVVQNIEAPLHEQTDLDDDMIEQAAKVKLIMAGLPADAAGKFPSQLSGGMRKRAGLARALSLDPDLLFLDEPTAGLDPIGAAAFDQLIRSLQQSLGLTVFMITHDLDSLAAICDRIAVLVDKRVIVGTMESLLEHDHPWIRDYFHGPRGRAALSAHG